jgi:penicillin-binding protein 2
MTWHPNEIVRRGVLAQIIVSAAFALLIGAFFRTQVLRNAQYVMQSEGNRLREVPLPAPRGIIYDREGRVLAENLPGYSVSLLAPTDDSLRSGLRTLSCRIPLTDAQIEATVKRWRRQKNRPAVVLGDASFDVISVLEEHRIEFPGLIIQSAPKRYYPDAEAIAAIIGYTGEITESELAAPKYEGYKAGQSIGKGGLERQYEDRLRGREGTRFVEVDAYNRVVGATGARPDIPPEAPTPLKTNIDLELQKYIATLFGDSLQGGAIVLEPKSGAVIALYSAPTFDPNRFTGGIPVDYWRQLNTDVRRPLYNKAIQGAYPPASTWKLATSAIAMERGLASIDTRMPQGCSGGYYFGNRRFGCWNKSGHGNVTLAQAIAKSCDVYFYQLGLKIGLSNLLAGGVSLKFHERSGIDLPSETRPRWPEGTAYFDRRYGARRWTNGVTLNLSIGQGENDQTVVNMARFYTALATDGSSAKPMIAQSTPERTPVLKLSPEQLLQLRLAMADVVSSRGTAGSAAIQGLVLAGKTGTAQNPPNPDHAWFVGFAPLENPTMVVAVFLEYGEHGYAAARVASRITERWLKAAPVNASASTDAQ